MKALTVLLLILLAYTLVRAQIDPSTSTERTPNLKLAEQMRNKQDWPNAILYYTKALESNEANGNVLTALIYSGRCEAYFSLNNFGLAILDCDKAILADPKLFGPYIIRGESKSRKGFIDEAITDFSTAIEIDPTSDGAYAFRGKAYAEKGSYDVALSDLNKALDLNPRAADNYRSRANLFEKKGELDHALADLSKAIALEPKSAFFYISRAIIYRKKGEFDLGIADCSKAIEVEPDYIHGYIYRGNMYIHKKEYDLAIADYDHALRIDSNSLDAFLFRGITKSQKGQYDEAILDYNKVLQIDPQFAGAYGNRGEAFFRKGECRSAALDFRKRVELEPKASSGVYSGSWAFLCANDGTQAYIDAEGFLATNGQIQGQGPYAVIVGYLALRKSDKPNEAKAFLAKWMVGSPMEAWPSRLMLYFRGDLSESNLLAFADTNDKLTEAHAYIGENQLLVGKLAEARSHLDWVIANGNKSFSEYILAAAEIRRLQSSPTGAK